MYLPVQPERRLQGDELLLLSHVQDVPQVDAGGYHYWLAVLIKVITSLVKCQIS